MSYGGFHYLVLNNVVVLEKELRMSDEWIDTDDKLSLKKGETLWSPSKRNEYLYVTRGKNKYRCGKEDIEYDIRPENVHDKTFAERVKAKQGRPRKWRFESPRKAEIGRVLTVAEIKKGKKSVGTFSVYPPKIGKVVECEELFWEDDSPAGYEITIHIPKTEGQKKVAFYTGNLYESHQDEYTETPTKDSVQDLADKFMKGRRGATA